MSTQIHLAPSLDDESVTVKLLQVPLRIRSKTWTVPPKKHCNLTIKLSLMPISRGFGCYYCDMESIFESTEKIEWNIIYQAIALLKPTNLKLPLARRPMKFLK